MVDMSVRRIQVQDEDAVLALARQMHLFSQYAHVPFDTDSFLLQLYNEDVHTVGVFVDDKLIGGGMFYIDRLYFNRGVKQLCDLAIFMSAGTRSYAAFKRIIKWAEDFAKQQGCYRVLLGITAPIDPKATLRVYEKAGYRLHGHVTVKEIT